MGIRDPRVTVLFNLARDFDSLYVRPIGTGIETRLDTATAEALFVETELGLRSRECSSTDSTACTKETLRASLPPLSQESGYLINQHYGITIEHARALAAQLFDGAVKHDLVGGGSRTNGAFHLAGTHTNSAPTGPIGTNPGWLKLDRDLVLAPYGFEDRAQHGMSVCTPVVPPWGPIARCKATVNPGSVLESHGALGVASVLAFAREVLFQEAARGGSAGMTDEDISSALQGLERLLGKRTILARDSSLDVIEPTSAPLESLVVPALPFGTPGLQIAAKTAKFVGTNGVSRATLTSAAAASGTTTAGIGAAAALRRSVWTPSSGSTWSRDATLLMRTGAGASARYTFVAEEPCGPCNGTGFDAPSTVVVTEGWFADLVSRVTAVQQADWSRPLYDGFGLPARWVPPADASLMGGSAGEESYQYLLRSAKSAADDATQAVKTAIDKLAVEATDSAALEQAERKASTISGLEIYAVCGDSAQCDLPMAPVYFRWDLSVMPAAECKTSTLTDSEGQGQCSEALKIYQDGLPERLELPSIVVDALGRTSVTFEQYNGTELQRVLGRIWNAGRLLRAAQDQAVKLAVSYGEQFVAVRDAGAQATAEDDAAAAQVAALKTKSDLQDEFGNYACSLEEQQEKEAKLRKRDKERLVALYCTQGGTDRCDTIFERGFGNHCDKPSAKDFSDELVSHVLSHPGSSGSPLGKHDDFLAANLRCLETTIQYKDLVRQYTTATVAHDKCIKTEALRKNSTDADIAAAQVARTASEKKVVANHSGGVSQRQQALVQVGAHVAVISQLAGETMQALAELESLQQKAAVIESKGLLEKSLAKSSYEQNESLRRKYRSYDLWRARALLESARRIAVAARRSIESRFVVDLSTLTSDQAFVASPSTWADEVYESDLNAPEVVGLSQAPKVDGAIYPNKLIDYVGNLERFVQGYTITYPTSISLPDTEILSFGGPEQTSRLGDDGLVLAPESAGWRFYCPNSGAWIGHPGIGQFPLTNRLATACGGSPPTHAKLGFWLNPWGTLNGAWTRPVYSDRHNVRWRRLAVNLVGTGIRECGKATDSMTCYTNPYIRYNLSHVGPSWQTNYSLNWRNIDITSAHIESGKALAAEEWLEPVVNSWNMPYVANVARGELFGRPAAGSYELIFESRPTCVWTESKGSSCWLSKTTGFANPRGEASLTPVPLEETPGQVEVPAPEELLPQAGRPLTTAARAPAEIQAQVARAPRTRRPVAN
ncbi:MAG: hypothetical protein QM784_39490 [Polyangiaceae bacterium]